MYLRLTLSHVSRDELADVCESFDHATVDHCGGDGFTVTVRPTQDARWLGMELDHLRQLVGPGVLQ